MRTISVIVPYYSKEENVKTMAPAVKEMFVRDLPGYDYELIFIGNDSKDSTREAIRRLCGGDERVRGIFSVRNLRQFNPPYYGVLQSAGDCTVLVACDFQDPVETIPQFVKKWESGYKIVIGIKNSSQENRTIYWLRECYYKIVKKLSDVEQIKQFTGFDLYDVRFVDVLRQLGDPTPFLRGVAAELEFRRRKTSYGQPKWGAGKTSNSFYRLYDAAMLGITSCTKMGLRMATIFGGFCSAANMVMAIVYLVMKLMYWDHFLAGMVPLFIDTCFLGSIQIFFIGLVGEYILSINSRVMKRLLMVEEERINFDNEDRGDEI